MVQQSVMNDERLQNFEVLAIPEPYVRRNDDTLTTNWTDPAYIESIVALLTILQSFTLQLPHSPSQSL